MSLLHWWELPWAEDFEDEDDQPIRPAEVLTTNALGGWWSASLELPDLDDQPRENPVRASLLRPGLCGLASAEQHGTRRKKARPGGKSGPRLKVPPQP